MDIKHLYRQIILDHHKSPKNKGLVESSDYQTERLFNPACGDDIKVQVLIKNNIIKDIKQDGQGCSICCSSASIMSEVLKEKKIKDANEIIQSFYNMLMDKPFNKDIITGEMLAYSGVKDFPARIGCATLPWKAIEKLLLETKEK